MREILTFYCFSFVVNTIGYCLLLFILQLNAGNLTNGYKLQDSLLEPIIVTVKNIMPDDFPVPCSCIKCFRDRSCRCRFDSRSCSELCDCSGKAICNNPLN